MIQFLVDAAVFTYCRAVCGYFLVWGVRGDYPGESCSRRNEVRYPRLPTGTAPSQQGQIKCGSFSGYANDSTQNSTLLGLQGRKLPL